MTKEQFIQKFNDSTVGESVMMGVYKKEDERGFYISSINAAQGEVIQKWFTNDCDSRGWIMEINAYID